MQFLFYISLERSPYNTTPQQQHRQAAETENSNKFIIVGFDCHGIG